MLLRPFGAMKGFCGGAVIRIGLGVAVVPSNGATDVASGSPSIGSTVAPGVCAEAASAETSTATAVAIAAKVLTPQAL